MTLSELARLANVSVSVASKAFSGKEGVSDAMREHVFAVARAHGCFQQFYNVPYDRPVVAVIVPEVYHAGYVRYIDELKQGLEQRGCTMLLSLGNFDPQMEQTLVKYYTEHGKVDGLVLISGHIAMPISRNVVCAKLGMLCEGESVDVHIKNDLQYGVDKAVAHLAALGHTRIAYVGEPLTVSKEQVVQSAIEKAGLPFYKEYMICSSHRFEQAGADGVRRLLALPQPPTAVLGSYGFITQGILAELQRQGLSVPRDMSVVSLNDNPDPLDATLDVATVREEIKGVCALIVEELTKRLGLLQKMPISHTVPLHFYKGESTAPPLS